MKPRRTATPPHLPIRGWGRWGSGADGDFATPPHLAPPHPEWWGSLQIATDRVKERSQCSRVKWQSEIPTIWAGNISLSAEAMVASVGADIDGH